MMENKHTKRMDIRKPRRKAFLLLAMLLGSGVVSAQVVIKGNVYGGCVKGIVTQSTSVTVNNDTVKGSVYGGCLGDTLDATAGVVKGNTWVYMNGGVVERSIYGGGQLGSVGTFTYGTVTYPADDPNGNENVEVQVPTSCASGTGVANVFISGGLVGVPNKALMPFTNSPGDDELGYVFCGSQGLGDSINYPQAIGHGVTDSTYLEISGGLITASAYGGSENGLVLGNTYVEIQGGQIGVGHYVDSNGEHNFDDPYTDAQWNTVIDSVRKGTLTDDVVANFHSCDAWPYKAPYAVYDIFADETGYSAQGGSTQGSNGHSFFGNVFGGGSGYYPFWDAVNDTAVWRRMAGHVYGNTTINISGGHILTCVYGGNEITDVDGKCTINMSGGTVGVPLTIDSIQARPVMNYILGAGMGDSRPMFNSWTDVGTTEVNITGGIVFGSVFGGGEDGHVLGDATVNINKDDGDATIGTWGCSYYDGNVFGGGRGYQGDAIPEGAVSGNTYVNIEKGLILGSVYGGGRLASVGILPVDETDPQYGAMQTGDDHGITTVNITGGTIGNKYEPLASQAGYDTKGGNVFGGSMGRLTNLDGSINHLWDSLAYVKKTIVNISQESSSVPTIIKGNVYGGCEFGKVHDSTSVNISGGRIGVIAYQKKTGSTDFDTIVHVTGGLVFGGGKGYKDRDYREAGIVLGNTHVTLSGGHVYYNMYGGGELASVGLREEAPYTVNGVQFMDYKPKKNDAGKDTGLATVTVKGGQVGPAPRVETGYNIPVGLNGVDGYVFGAGKGVSEDWINPAVSPYSGSYPDLADVNNTRVTINMPMPTMPANNATDTINRIWGSTFGGAEDGHVLGSARTYYKNGLMGTTGTTTYDGNIFGGGRNYSKKNYNAGRVRVNDSIDMCGGQIYGSIFGGGRLALTGIDLYGNILPDTADVKHGNTFVKVSGGTVGNNDTIEEWIASSMGDVYGGGKGDTIGIYGHPKASALLISLVKNAEVLITDTVIDGNPRSPRILGSVFGGGEVACVGQFTWNIGEYSGVTNIGDITPVPGTGKTKVTVNGGVIGADKAQMRLDMVDGTGKYDLKYNDDRGHVFGGGEGWTDDPAKYAVINPSSGTPGIHNNKRLIDLMALVGETQVTIGETARKTTLVKGSVYGGSMNGHVVGNTKVTVSGGQIGAGYNPQTGLEQAKYDGDKFLNPVGYFTRHDTDTDIHADSALLGCYRWDYVANDQQPFDPIKLKTVANYKPTNGESWFGHVFGGGSGYYPYIVRNQAGTADSCVWNPDAGKVFGHTEVEITGGHILSNVYGGNQTTDVGNYVENGTTHQLENNSTVAQAAKTIVTISGGSVGVPRIIDSIQAYPFTSSVYGGGQGSFRDEFKKLNNVDSTRVEISGNALVYGNVFGGSQNAHVLDSTRVLVKGGVVGTTGLSGYDGNVFGGGQGTMCPNPGHLGDSLYAHAGRVGGNAKVVMSDGKALGNLYGGGMVALTGVGLNGWFDAFTTGTTYDSEHHGKAKVELSGGYVGNYFNGGLNLLKSSYASGNVYGAGRGKLDEYDQDDLARSANSAVEISDSPTVYGSVFGGGQMANAGYWLGYAGWYATNTASTSVTITGTPTIGTALEFVGGDNYAHHPGDWTFYDKVRYVNYEADTYDTTYLRVLTHTRTGNVYGGGQGDVQILDASHRVAGLEQGHCANTNVNINMTNGDSGGHIRSSVFGGSEQGVVWGETEVHIAGGTIGSTGIVPDSLRYNYATHAWDTIRNNTLTYYHGNVFGGSYGDDYYSTFSYLNIPSPRPTMIDSINNLAGRVYGNTLVDITGGTIRGNVFGGGNMASVGIWNKESNDLIPIADPVRTTYRGNATVTVNGSSTVIGPLDGTGMNAYVFGGGKGFSNDPDTLRKAYANVDSTFVTVSGGTIWGSVFGGGSDSHVLGSTSVIVHSGANIGTNGLTTWDGNIFGGGRNFMNTNHTNGRVAGNIDIAMDGGTLQGSIFGGGRLALTGVNMEGLPYLTTNTATEQVYDSINHGYVHINVTGGSIGNTDGMQLLTGSDESVGDIFGSGKGDTKAYEDIWAGRVAKTKVEVGGTTTRIYGSVFGGGEMAGIGYWDTITDNSIPNGTFMKGTGMSEVIISGSPEIGTDTEYSSVYASTSQAMHEWTVFDSDNHNDSILIHTCTGNVFGGSQGDVDPESPAWVSMARSRTAKVTINGGIIKSYVYGGSEQGTVMGNTHVTVTGGTIGHSVTSPGGTTYLFGGVHGGGYGSHRRDYNISVLENDSLKPANLIAGRVYGNTFVDIMGGTIVDVYGGANYAYVGGYGTNPKGNTLVNIGSHSTRTDVYTGDATIQGNVFGANNHAGTPYGDVEVNIYSTAHTEDNEYPDPAPTTPQALGELSTDPSKFALKAVYAGSNHADYLPVAGKEATVHVWGCEENTIYDVYGGCDAAAIGSSTAGYSTNTNVIVDGGRIYQVFGGGNGSVTSADIHGTANTTINGGLINELFGGSNNMGLIDDINLVVNQDGDCPVVIADGFGGNNSADLIGDLVVTLQCGDNPPTYGNFYCGSRLGDIYGNITVNVMGGEITNLFAGSRGQADDPGTLANEAISADIFEITQEFIDAHPEYSGLVAGHGGNITLNLYGGSITNAFGGSDVWSQIDGKITINVLDTVDHCALNLTNVYGGGRYTPYTPLLVEGNKINSPEVNIIHGEIQGNVFGGALGDTATVAANPVVRIGYDPVAMAGIIQPYYDPGVHQTYFDPDTSSVSIGRSVYGGGEEGDIIGNPSVNITKHSTIVGGNVYGGGYGYNRTFNDTIVGLVDGNDTLRIKGGHVLGHVYGGGALAAVTGNTYVELTGGTIGEMTIHTDWQGNDSIIPGLNIPYYDLSGGRVYGGGQGHDTIATGEYSPQFGRVFGNTYVHVSDTAKIRNCVYGGGALSSVGLGRLNEKTSGVATVIISGGEIGPLNGSGMNAYVYGGGRGKDDDENENYALFANVDSTSVIVCDSARIYGSIFGGGADGHVLGDASVQVKKSAIANPTHSKIPVIGTNGKTSWDGNIFGGGRNYLFSNLTAGRVGGNIRVDISDGELKGNVYGGGRLGLTGMDSDGNPIAGNDHGCITVNISGGTIGTAVDTVTIGHVFGGGKGSYLDDEGWQILNFHDLAKAKQTQTNISGGVIHGSVYGGGEIALVTGTTSVNISGGTIGGSSGTLGDPDYYQYGSVYGGGKGFKGSTNLESNPISGQVGVSTEVVVSGGQIYENVFGGGEMSSVGDYEYDETFIFDDEWNWIGMSYEISDFTNGNTNVTISGGEIGPLDGTGKNGHVYGGGKGFDDEYFKAYANVDSTSVIVCDSARIYGSVFGGAADGHVLGDASVQLKVSGSVTDTMPFVGTDGMTGYDGNIYGGGEGSDDSFTVGRVEGNTTVEMMHGTVYGNIYGGGRLALTGVDMDGSMQSGTDHGNTKVMIKGGTVGNNNKTGTNPLDPDETVIETFTWFSMGNIYGGGKGYLDTDHPDQNDAEKSLLLGLTKNTTIEVSDTLGNNTHVYGIILGGGEIASVGSYELYKDPDHHDSITSVTVSDGGLATVRISGGIIGGDRSQMRYELEDPSDPDNFYLLYNDDLGYVYGGGEGWSADPADYDSVYTNGLDHPATSLIDLIATVQNTEVTITNDTTVSNAVSKPYVKASVFGGAESGHVMHDTKVTIAGGQIGAGTSKDANNHPIDLPMYTDGTDGSTNYYINPLIDDFPANMPGTYHWDYGHEYGDATHYDPFDPVYIKNGYSGGTYTIYPSDGKSWFGNVFGGGSGWFPYQKKNSSGEYQSYWNSNSGKVWGNTEVNITGGHILNNVYGANESTDVSGKATIKMSGGTVGVPRTAAQVAEQPVICYVFGGGCGDPRDVLDGTTNAGSTDVQITGGIIYGSVFGGAEDGHVLGDVEVTIGKGDEFTVGEAPNAITYTYPVIGSTGTSGADGNLFGGGRNFLRENVEAGRVQGNIDIEMDGGVFLGSIYGGGRQGLTGVDASGNNITDDPTLHGNVTIDISGGTVGNRSHVLTHTASSIGDVFGGGKGHDTNANLGRVKNTEVKISETDATNNPTRILGNVYGGGELANVGWVTEPGTNYVATTGGLAKIEISGGQVGIEQIGTAQASIVGGNVFGGGYGLAGGKDQLPFANVDTTHVKITSNAYIIGSVFGGADNGHVWRNTSIEMDGGTVGQKNTLAELTVDANEQPTTDHIYTGSVLAGGRGITPEATSPAIVYNDTTGIVFGNATDSITGGVVRHAVYGGGGLSHVGTFTRDASTNDITFTSGGKCTVYVAGDAHIGPTVEDFTALAGNDNAKKNTFFNMLGGNAGWVFGAGCGLAGHPDLTFCDSTLVTISGSAQVTGAAFGGGENGHVLDSTHIVISGGTIGGIPLHGTGLVNGTGDFTGVSFTATTNELTEDIYGSGPRVFRGNVYGGGKGNDSIPGVSPFRYSYTAGRVYGNSKVEITGGTIYNRVFGGGLLASVGTFRYKPIPNTNPVQYTDSITGTVKGTGLAKVIVSGGQIGTDGNNNGDVFGGGRGLVGRHWEPNYTTGDQVVNMAYVDSTEVIINNGANIKSNVFGGSGSGHVQGGTHVVVNGGTIGISGHGGWHSNVYGGGGGQHQYQRTPTTTHHSITSGRVFGNTTVEIKGGTIYHNVYGGGAIASVGTYNIYATTMEGLFKPGTGDTEVTITGGIIGVDGNENGMVFGSGRGQIAPIGAFMDSLSYAVNTVVNIGTEGSSDGPMVHGSVYGSGENGHVFKKATVNVYSGTIGCENYETAHASFFANHGNVYGAGCGTDMYDSDGNGSEDSYNPRSGIVQGNTEVNIKGGHISRNVYGGGAMALVGYYDVSTGGTPAEPGMWGDDIVGVTPFTGKTVVNVSGGTIGTASTTGHVVPDNVEHGNVFGGSRGPNSGDGFTNMALVDTSFVFISGDDTHVLGNVFGGGAKSLVRTARVATISGGTIGTDGLLNSSGVYNGYVFGGSQHGLDDIDSNPYTSLKTVNVRGGHIMGNVFGCSDDAVEGDPSVDVLYNPVWTSFVNITGGNIDQNVYGAGKDGTVHGSVCVNIGATAVKKAPTKETVNSEEVNMNKFMSISENGTPVVPAPDTTIVIGGSVYAGSQGGPNGWKQFDISQYAVVYIDGKGYDTKSETIPTVHTTDGPYMNIAGGLIGSGTHCESGSKGRQIVLKNYGHRNADKDDEFTSATRSLTTIQRCGHVLLDSTNVKLSGAYDITVASPSSPTNWKYGVFKVDTAMYVYDGSGIVLGAAHNPVYMDSIRVLKSVLLAEGTIYDSALLYKLRWDTIGIMNNDNKLHRIHNGSATEDLESNYENVIIFNDTSRLWVRYTDKKAGDIKDTTYYGELQGFFRMRADEYEPRGSESFAYARPKITDGRVNENISDGGFLSYQNAYNYFTDHGAPFTKTKQYPYVNVLGGTRADRNEFRIWAYPSRGNVWYVDGRPTGGWGNDEMRKKEHEAGLYPDKPKKTLFAAGKGVVTETYTSADAIYNYSYKNDQIYVVGALSESDGAVLKDSIGGGKRFPLRLYRYPGGHAMSNGETDEGNGSVPATWGGVAGSAGPGANYGALLDVASTDSITLKGVVMDGLYDCTQEEQNDHMIPASFDTAQIMQPLIITHASSTLTLCDSTVLMRGYNHQNAYDWYTNPDYKSYTSSGPVYNGAAIFVDSLATVYVEDTVVITGNKQRMKIGDAPATLVESNVYLPTFATHLNIKDELHATLTRIGITSPRRNRESDYKYNTFSPVAVATTAAIASDAHKHNNFLDDMDMFFVNGYTPANGRSTYYATSIPDYPGFIDEAETMLIDPTKTLFFGWTWTNVVRTAPSGYDVDDLDSEEDLAWFISTVNGLNGQTATASPTASLKADVDMKQYVWVPVGAVEGNKPFSGSFDGRGHIIENLSVDYIGTGDRRYEYDNYGLFGNVVNGTVDRTFVVSGIIRPEGKANIGGLVGFLQANAGTATVKNSEAAVQIKVPSHTGTEAVYVGGLVGLTNGATIHSSMAMPDIDCADDYGYVGGLLGGNTSASANLLNSFANAKFTLSDGAKTGGLVGNASNLTLKNCYSHLYDKGNLDETGTAKKFGLLAGEGSGASITHCYFSNDGFVNQQGYGIASNSEGMTMSKCNQYSPVSDADTYGYLHLDNKVSMDDVAKPMYQWLNECVESTASGGLGGSKEYARWTRPTLSGINGDLPVLLLDNYDGSDHIGLGDFRSVATIAGSHALQYGGEARDGSGHELGTMLARSEDIYVYGDVTENLSSATINAKKVAIHEDAAIITPGALADYANTYVGVSFDNSAKQTYDVNGLARDWHMLSTPLKNAPLGINYVRDGVDENDGTNDPSYDPYTGAGGALPAYPFYEATEHDGYFPYNTPYAEYDFYCFNEYTMYNNNITIGSPQWINFKRNGNSHYFSQEQAPFSHGHIDYYAYDDAETVNVNEPNLVQGKGYMMALQKDTYLQSHGKLNGSYVTINISNKAVHADFGGKGCNLVGNPFHAYLDFDKFAQSDGSWASPNEGLTGNAYYVYDADHRDYISYTAGGSVNGDYADQYIHPHQGFFVKSTASTNTSHTITFTPEMLVTRNEAGDVHFRNDERPAYPLVNLYAEDGEGRNEVVVIEFNRPDNGGGKKAYGLRSGNHMLYAHNGNDDYCAFFAKEGTEKVPVRFKTYQDGIFTMRWNTANGNFHSLYLIDNITGVTYDMLQNDSYTFNALESDYLSRFYIVFDVTDVEEFNENHIFAFYDGNNWVVNGTGFLQLIDVTGRIIYEERLRDEQNHINLRPYAKGVYLMRLTNHNIVKTQKIIH